MSYKRTEQQTNRPIFQSQMTSEQKYHQIVDSVIQSMPLSQKTKIKGCSIHPQPSKKCRKCRDALQIHNQQE